ncbi:hypothetical protein DFJ43DRAFT_1207568 [Lentinula guzmanii]|uniref:Uncharacterized protein n=1 Tax=Lentinula guzmanii TaxID=2804957 RepID=A0AA38JIQ6_9AGAR|nr:hypothetical protein DFJ43DRAFT_1207568 [Lentinula guzmanii]
MSGLINLKGSGQYLDTSKSNISLREVSMICTTCRNLKRLDLKGSDTITVEAYQRAIKHGATHVVTGIIYGGTLITNVIEKASSSESQTKIHGEFTASLMKKMALTFSAEGKAAADSEKTCKDVLESHNFDFYRDYTTSDRPNAITIGDLFELAKKWPDLVGEGAPCQITVTPLDQFVDGSIEARILHKLESYKLGRDFFNSLEGEPGFRLHLKLGAGILVFASQPSWMPARSARSLPMAFLDGPDKYLVAFREGGADKAGKSTTEFVDAAKVSLVDHLKECEGDESVLGLFQSIQDLASAHSVLLETLNGVRRLMTRANQGMLGVVLIPPSPKLGAAEDKKDTGVDGKAKETFFISFYCDPALVPEILNLNGKKGVLKKALDRFEKSQAPCFVHYGMIPTGLSSVQKQINWCLLSDEGWAFIHNDQESFD